MSTLSEVRFPSLRGQRVVVTGAGGQLGRYLVPTLRAAGAIVIAAGSRLAPAIDVAADLSDRNAAIDAIAAAAPDVIIHAAACTDVDGIEREPERGEINNVRATRHVAAAAQACSAYLLAVSTDMVFPGDGGAPYDEDDATQPISAYGASKLAAERAVLESSGSFAVARTAWLYGGAAKHFPRTALTVLRDRGSMDVVDDEWGNPTFAGDLAAALRDIAARRGGGVFHLVNVGRASRFELARETAILAGFDPAMVRPISSAEFLSRFPLPAKRPRDSTLQNKRAAELNVTFRGWREALASYVPSLADEIMAQPAMNRG